MRHVEKALHKLVSNYPESSTGFITLSNVEDVKGVAPLVSFTIQSDPIREVGVNGVQALDMLKYVKCLFESLNEAFPCRENSLTMTKIERLVFESMPVRRIFPFSMGSPIFALATRKYSP